MSTMKFDNLQKWQKEKIRELWDAGKYSDLESYLVIWGVFRCSECYRSTQEMQRWLVWAKNNGKI